MNKTLAIDLQDVTRDFGSFTAVDRINLQIPVGQIFGLLGPNGAGKTTTIRMICGILLPTSGKITVLGFDGTKQSEDIKKHIGYMSQRFALYDDLNVEENLNFYMNVYALTPDQRKTRLPEILMQIGLKGLEKKAVRELSGAWRQRLALGCAIAHHPQLLILDEPTAGVDPISRRVFWHLIYELADEGTTVLATTHYMDEAEHCHVIGMMHRARLIAMDTPENLRNTMPGTILEIVTENSEGLVDLINKLSVKGVSLHGTRVHVVSKDEAEIRILKQLILKAGFKGCSFSIIQPTLEDIFLNLIETEDKTFKKDGED